MPQLIGDQNPAHNLTYLYGPDGLPFEQIDTVTATSTWFHQDATGSIRCTTDDTGTLTSTQTFTPWGESVDSTGTPPRLGYKSKQTDPSGLIYLQARYYDPETAQFLSVDPLAPITHTRYGYTNNNPLNGADPNGLVVQGFCLSASVGSVLAIEGQACIVSDGVHSGVLVISGVGSGTPQASIAGALFMSSADSVFDLSETQGCLTAQGGVGPGVAAELCIGRDGSDSSIFVHVGGTIEPGGSMSGGVYTAKYYSFSEIFGNYLRKIFGCEPGPSPTRHHRNPDGGWGSGGVSPNMDGNGLPLPPRG
ncbi:MAG TPA: RHS repeat-associated core domain-containing protein [Acidimicrobiales bacterium]|nr:RHS repeat-associated core domain-containing protein [Acidimicrobiales bacterium]